MAKKRGDGEHLPIRGGRRREHAAHSRRVQQRTAHAPERRRVEHVVASVPAVLFDYVPPVGGRRDRFVYVSPTSRELLGVEAEALVRDSQLLFNMIPGEDRARLRENIAAAVRARAPLDTQFRVVTPAGHRKWLQARSLPAAKPAGAHLVWYGILLDVTQQRRAEDEIEQQWLLFRRLVETSPDVICRFDPHHRVLYANPAVGVLGLSAELAVGKACGELRLPPELCRAWDEALATAIDSRETARCELVARAQDGVEHRYDVMVVPELGVEGNVESVLSIGRDVTGRLAAERALREADRRKDEFLAVLSHELRNPLAPIQNALYILGRVAPGSEQEKRARGILERQMAHLTHLVDDLLDMTRIERNRIQLQRQLLELNELVRRVAEDHRSTFDAAGVQLELEPAPGPLFVDADPTRLAQMIANLLNNAAKFTPRGGSTRVGVTREGARVIISVSDTGVGMTEETRGRIFEPFAQGPPGLARTRGGLGLGLTLVKGLAEQHGGEVEALSAGPGRGSEFRVRLPLIEMPEPIQPPAHPGAHRTFGVLVVEDNVDAANTLREVLEMSGHAVQVAHTGPEAIARAREFHPQVVLCDIGLPGMDGYEVARAFRADPALSGTHLVALSGYALPEDVQRATDAGFEVHLPKPPSVERLEATLGALSG
jgi:PAS domain S-box-containing protein